MNDELHWWTARRLTRAIAERERSAREILTAQLERIEAVNPQLNAIVTLDPEGALAQADRADAQVAAGEPLGPLHGLGIAVKDLEDTAGMRTTYGSRMFADHIPAADTLMVARLRAAGAIILGKTNTPEFGAGSHTFNEVFGATRNPWARDRSAGGSSGGAGAALAAGLIAIADGSDNGGSIRNPSSFNGVVGLRPSPGLIPASGPGDVWDPAAVLGPMARTVGDLSLMLAATAGSDPRVPLSHGDPNGFLTAPVAGDLHGLRVAWWPDVGGLPIEPAVARAIATARERMVACGCEVQDLSPDFTGVDEAYETLRALGFARQFGDPLPTRCAEVKQTVIWNIECGMRLRGPEIARAQKVRGAVFTQVAELLERFDVIAAPAAQVAPFPIELENPRDVDGVTMEHYLGWMRACTRITLSSHPVLAVRAGFTEAGLPVGLQLVGGYRRDRNLLALGTAWETATGLAQHHPPGL